MDAKTIVLGVIVERRAGKRWDAFAVEDAFALRAEIAIARLQPALDPRLRTFLDRARHRLRGVADEAGLDAALDGFRPIVDALARWPRPRDPSPSGAGAGSAGRPDLSWPDRRALRFCAAFTALWALRHGPDDECGRMFARTAVGLGRARGDRGSRVASELSFTRDLVIVNCMSFVRHSPGPGSRGRRPLRRERVRPTCSTPSLRLDAAGRTLCSDPRRVVSSGLAHGAARPDGSGDRRGGGAPPHGGAGTARRARARAGWSRSVSIPRPAAGAPPRRYVLAPDPAEREAAGHRELVHLLMSLVREAGFGPIEIERFGERQGASIARPGAGRRRARRRVRTSGLRTP